MIGITVSTADLYDVQRTLNATNGQIERAGVRAINKTLAWGRSIGRRNLAQEHDLPLKTLRNRLRTGNASADTLKGSLWFGTRPIKAVYAGSPTQSAAGVNVRGHSFLGAFIARMPSGHLGIYKRRGGARLPIAEQMIHLQQAQSVIDGIARAIPDRLRTIYEQELNYELNVRGEG